MKTVNKFALASVLTSCVVFSGQAIELKAGNDSSLTHLCITAASGNRPATYNAIKATGYSHRFVMENVRCNADDMISFIQQYGKNSDGMIRALKRQGTQVTISDIAMLARQYR